VYEALQDFRSVIQVHVRTNTHARTLAHTHTQTHTYTHTFTHAHTHTHTQTQTQTQVLSRPSTLVRARRQSNQDLASEQVSNMVCMTYLRLPYGISVKNFLVTREYLCTFFHAECVLLTASMLCSSVLVVKAGYHINYSPKCQQAARGYPQHQHTQTSAYTRAHTHIHTHTHNRQISLHP
jgi:hypothetical protein